MGICPDGASFAKVNRIVTDALDFAKIVVYLQIINHHGIIPMKHIQYSVALLFLMLSAQPSSGQSSHSVSHNNVALGLNHRNADSSLVSRLNVGLANNVDSLRGLQLGLTTANVNRDARGVNIGLLGTLTRGDMIGLQLAGTGNGVAGTTKGVQIAPFTNYATVLRGMQLGGIINIAVCIGGATMLKAPYIPILTLTGDLCLSLFLLFYFVKNQRLRW